MKKFLFMTENKDIIDVMWNAQAEKKCREYGFCVDVPALSENFSSPDWQKMAAEYDGIITTWKSPKCTAEFLKDAPNVKVIGHCAGSVVPVTDESTYLAGYRVTTANYIMSRSVAEWCLLAVLMAQRNIACSTSFGRKQPMDWKQQFNMGDIRSMTIGIWGLGDTTRHLMKMLAPLEPGRVLISSNHSGEDVIAALGAEKAGFDTLLEESDIFLCLAGVNKENFQRIRAAEFSKMKPDSVFINCGRSRLCCENDLLAALQSKRIRAILDVYDKEPLPEDSLFYDLDNVILTPHNAGYPGRERFMSFILDEFHRFFSGEPMLSEVSLNRFRSMTNEFMK